MLSNVVFFDRNKVRLNVDFTVAVNEAEQLPVPKHHCEFCLWRYTANDDISVKKPFITVPPHLEFFLHDSSHTSSIDEKNTGTFVLMYFFFFKLNYCRVGHRTNGPFSKLGNISLSFDEFRKW
jgi:hypothetical protein